jgi:hypothetical protein
MKTGLQEMAKHVLRCLFAAHNRRQPIGQTEPDMTLEKEVLFETKFESNEDMTRETEVLLFEI